MARMLAGCPRGKCTRSNSFECAVDIQVTSRGRQGQRRQEGLASICMGKCNRFGSREQKTCHTETRGERRLQAASWQAVSTQLIFALL